ncbi:hypothetical protein GCM10022229_21780 [Luteimonas lutimaris]|uniref:Uncharacterized protein n=2 Tax=Luteimonas lutimaris TaxID=698645 RepID=A0ABP7MRP7_9GAMM
MAKAQADGKTAAKVPEDEQVDVPNPVRQFEAYCYRTYSDYKRTAGMAELNKLRPMPRKFNPAIEAEAAQGKAYIVETTKDPERAIFLAITEANTCSIYANGYDRSEIQKSLQTS